MGLEKVCGARLNDQICEGRAHCGDGEVDFKGEFRFRWKWSELASKSAEAGRLSPQTCRASVSIESKLERMAMTQRKPHNSSRRLIFDTERGTPKRLVLRFRGGHNNNNKDRQTHSLLGQVFEHHRPSNRSFQYMVSVRKCGGYVQSPQNLSAAEQSTGNKSTSVSKDDHPAIPSLATVLSLQDPACHDLEQ
jgi:hypothetical protein